MYVLYGSVNLGKSWEIPLTTHSPRTRLEAYIWINAAEAVKIFG